MARHTPAAICRGRIDGILALVREHDLQPDEIFRIEVAILEAGWLLVAEPRAQKYHPQSVVEAQFSMPFGAAMAVLYRAAGIDQFTEENVLSKSVRRIMGRVVLEKDIRIEKNLPEEWPARVAIDLVDGRHLETVVQHPKGDPKNPLSWDEFVCRGRSMEFSPWCTDF